jgi:hypothetical protein
MNFTQMHERLRLELLRRIQRGTLSVSLLARQTGFGQPHLSNFLHNRRQLSLEALDRVMAAQHLTAADLLPVLHLPGSYPIDEEHAPVPVVTHHAALFEPSIRPSIVQSLLHLPPGLLARIRGRISPARRTWQRFVAVRIAAQDAVAMQPLLLPEAIVLLDRHYTVLVPYRSDWPNLYAVRQGARLTVRYVEYAAHRLILRPHNLNFPIEAIEVDAGEPATDLIAGRVAYIMNET